MVEKILENVINEMVLHLEDKQLEHLRNVLYINFHGKEKVVMRQRSRCLLYQRKQ